jgi:hypothetical protein
MVSRRSAVDGVTTVTSHIMLLREIADILQWVRIQQQEIGAFTDCNGSRVGGVAQMLCDGGRSRL